MNCFEVVLGLINATTIKTSLKPSTFQLDHRSLHVLGQKSITVTTHVHGIVMIHNQQIHQLLSTLLHPPTGYHDPERTCARILVQPIVIGGPAANQKLDSMDAAPTSHATMHSFGIEDSPALRM